MDPKYVLCCCTGGEDNYRGVTVVPLRLKVDPSSARVLAELLTVISQALHEMSKNPVGRGCKPELSFSCPTCIVALSHVMSDKLPMRYSTSTADKTTNMFVHTWS